MPDYLLNPVEKTGPVETVEEFDADKIRKALGENKFNRTLTAQQLKIHPATLWRKMKRYGIE